ncbi:PAN domain-containing protein [Aphelenchoides avenae]|nr:PAN domain-containing protein [Aphelenchus avenae]
MTDAVPFHSEWRMKSEEHCLEFCIRASSRCASIVYDKQDHICHYFFAKGIEEDKLVKQPKMVYLQVAEKKCVDDMLSAMELEEEAARVAAAAPDDFSNDDTPGVVDAKIGDGTYNGESAPDVENDAQQTTAPFAEDISASVIRENATNASVVSDTDA